MNAKKPGIHKAGMETHRTLPRAELRLEAVL